MIQAHGFSWGEAQDLQFKGLQSVFLMASLVHKTRHAHEAWSG